MQANISGRLLLPSPTAATAPNGTQQTKFDRDLNSYAHIRPNLPYRPIAFLLGAHYASYIIYLRGYYLRLARNINNTTTTTTTIFYCKIVRAM